MNRDILKSISEKKVILISAFLPSYAGCLTLKRQPPKGVSALTMFFWGGIDGMSMALAMI